MSFFSARLAEFEKMRSVGMWKDTLLYYGTTYNGIRPPFRRRMVMQGNNYQEEVSDEFTMLATEFESSGIHVHSRYSAHAYEFEIHDIEKDASEPTVVLRAVRKQ